MDIFHGRNQAMDLLETEATTSRTKTYMVIEHLNAAVNLLRSMKNYNMADEVKESIRKINSKPSEQTE